MVKSHAVIFVNTTLQRPGLELLVYEDAELRASMYRELYEDVHGYDEVETCLNLTREETIVRLDRLGDEAKTFGQNHAEKTSFAIDVVFIGFKLSYSYHKDIIDKLQPAVNKCADGSITMDEYILSQTGHTLNLPEFIERIAQNPNVQVGLLEEWQG